MHSSKMDAPFEPGIKLVRSFCQHFTGVLNLARWCLRHYENDKNCSVDFTTIASTNIYDDNYFLVNGPPDRTVSGAESQ